MELISTSGIAALNAQLEEIPIVVAPTDAAKFNTIKVPLVPVACWRVEDINFEFASSIPNGTITQGLKHLAQVMGEAAKKDRPDLKEPNPITIFGHADPVGEDEPNKGLAGRRAQAIYGLLTRDVEIWEDLFKTKHPYDNWDTKSLQVMLDTVAGPSGQSTAQHEADATKRKQLFADFMKRISPAELAPIDKKKGFLAQGADAGGKGDFQGCGEFNPVMVFSQAEEQKFTKAADKTERDTENTINRRVMVLIYRKSSKVDPAKWPCPRVKEGTAGCRKRFFPDGDSRRTKHLPSERRLHEKKAETFACRFYERATDKAPCERRPPVVVARVLKMRAILPSTQPNTPRAAPVSVANLWPNPVDLVFESSKQLAKGAISFQDADFAIPKALVAMRNGEGPIRLEVDTAPAGAQVIFQVVRASDDAAAIGTGLPTITSTGPTTASLATNERGSFFVLAFVDRNGNGQRDLDETGMILPLVLVEARIENAAAELRSVANPGNLNIQFNTGGQAAANFNFVNISTGDFNSQATAGIALDADALLVGGGASGRRGLDRVFTGWANNFTALNYVGTYQDGSNVRRVQIDNRNQVNGGNISGIPVFVTRAGAAAPNAIAFPPQLLDTGRARPELGGENITFSRSTESAPTNQALGVKRTVIARDSPGWFHQRQHPDSLKATQLVSFVHSLNSTTYLVAWTNTTGGAPPTPGTANSVGFRTFTVIAETQWTVTAQFSVNRAGGNFVLQQTGNVPNITATNVDHGSGVTPSAVRMEVRPPETLQSRAIDAC